MPKRSARLRFPLLLLGSVALVLASGVDADESKMEQQISFGVKMAQRGLWSEALFRFQQAAAERPGDSRILNNLAVAYEAVGQYEDALEVYQEALRADSANRELKRNYSRFVEFYQAFKPDTGETAITASDQETEPESVPPSSQSGQ